MFILDQKVILKYWNSPTFVTWLSFFTKSFNLVLIIPLLLKKIDPADVSLWYIFLAIVNLLSTIDAGFGSTFARAVAYENKENFTKHDEEYLTSLNFVIRKYFFIIGGIVLLLVFIYIQWSSRYKPEINKLFFISLLLTPITAFGNYYVCILTGINKVLILRRWESFTNILITISNLIILLISPNVYWLILGYQLWSIFNVLKNFWLTKKFFNFYDFTFKYDSFKAKQIESQFLGEAVKSVIGVISSLGLFYLVSLYYSIYFDSNKNLLAMYLFCFNIVQSIRSFSQAPFYSKLPILNQLYSQGRFEELIKLAEKGIRRSVVAYIAPLVVIILFGADIFEMIESKIAFPPIELWILLSFGFLVERVGGMYLQVYSTTNHIIWDKLNFGTAIIIILVMYVLMNKFQIYTFPIALIIGYSFFYTPISYYLSSKLVHSLKNIENAK